MNRMQMGDGVCDLQQIRIGEFMRLAYHTIFLRQDVQMMMHPLKAPVFGGKSPSSFVLARRVPKSFFVK